MKLPKWFILDSQNIDEVKCFSETFDKVTKIFFLEHMKIFTTSERKEKKEKSNSDIST